MDKPKPVGLYEGLSNAPKVGVVPTASEFIPQTKKRPNEGAPSSQPQSKRPTLAPRVALQNDPKPEKKTSEISSSKPVVVVREETTLDSSVGRSNNITHALQEAKDPYDPSKPNQYNEYLRLKLIQSQDPAPNKGKGPKGKPDSVAENMMKKMGWKGRGHGLGRNDQGMALPLIAQTTGVGGQGVIINTTAVELQKNSVNPTGTAASRVIVLTNMVALGQVDKMLQAETAQECGKYGAVLGCEVWEARKVVPPDEAVKIYVKFKYPDQALKALIDLDGRFFGGRTVRADYYPEFSYDAREFQSA